MRIACRELENWYLGDQDALKSVLPDVKKNWKNPDNVFGSDELNNSSKKFTKTNTAREMGKIIKINGNESPSFNQFLTGLNKLIIQV